jgi:hypothetical protein
MFSQQLIIKRRNAARKSCVKIVLVSNGSYMRIIYFLNVFAAEVSVQIQASARFQIRSRKILKI